MSNPRVPALTLRCPFSDLSWGDQAASACWGPEVDGAALGRGDCAGSRCSPRACPEGESGNRVVGALECKP